MKKLYLKKAFGVFKRALPFLLILAVLLGVLFFPKPAQSEGEETKRVVRIWNVDTFEGGKGSRTNFLKRAASVVERKDEGVYYLISSYTLEGAQAAFEKGEAPDALSFGLGLSEYMEQSLTLPYMFAGGKTDWGCLAYPWCRGQYMLFSLIDDFEAEGSSVISNGGNNLPLVSAALEGIEGEEHDSLSAYVEFLQGKYRYLLGTQRDYCRLVSRNASFYVKPLEEYCDLYQYFSILSVEKERDCLEFLNVLLSQEMQDALSQIGMYPVKGEGAKATVSVFSAGAALEELKAIAGRGDTKNLTKFLKNI